MSAITKNGRSLDSGNGSNAFLRLPTNIILKIILDLPWRQRLLCRRVNKQWLRVCNSALALSTKVIDTGKANFLNASTSDVNHLIPIVADGLESLSLPAWYDFSFVNSVVAFRSLREINLSFTATGLPAADQFFQILDKSPNLKKISAPIPPIPLNLFDVDQPRKKYESVEQLHLCSPDVLDVTEPYLMAIADHFPNLSSLRIDHYQYLTGSGASALVEKYGPKLDVLEIRRYSYGPISESFIPPMGVFTGISACSNLTHLVLANSNLTSNEFMSALASGCVNLETLDLSSSKLLTSTGVAALADLPKLRKLDISYGVRRLDHGVAAIGLQGRLVQLVARDVVLTAETIKTCFRYCRGLELVDIRNNDNLTPEDAEAIMNLWGRYGLQPRLVLRSFDPVLRSSRISQLQEDIKNGQNHDHRGRLIIDARQEPAGFLKEGEDAAETDLLVLEDEDNGEDEMSDFSGSGDLLYDPWGGGWDGEDDDEVDHYPFNMADDYYPIDPYD